MRTFDLARYTTDPQRFLDYYPLAKQLESVEPGTPEALAIYRQAGNPSALQATLRELAAFNFDQADALKAELRRRTAP